MSNTNKKYLGFIGGIYSKACINPNLTSRNALVEALANNKRVETKFSQSNESHTQKSTILIQVTST